MVLDGIGYGGVVFLRGHKPVFDPGGVVKRGVNVLVVLADFLFFRV